MDLKAIGLGVAFAVMWSSAFTTARMIVMDAPPLTALTVRFLVSGLLGIGIALALGQTWRLARSQWRGVLIFGLCQNAAYLGVNFVAMQTVEASFAAIVASTMPLVVAIAGWWFFGDRVRPLGIAGLMTGFTGVVIIMWARLSGGIDPWGFTLLVGGVAALTAATLAVRGASAGGNLLMVVGLQMLVGAAVLGVLALLFEEWDVTWTPRLVAAFAWTTLIPGLVATLTWFVLVGRIGATRAAAFHFLNPFLGVAIAALLLGERLSIADVAGVAIIMAGILAVQMSRAPPRTTTA